jgi:PhzF family phenazine biosynthesis protein
LAINANAFLQRLFTSLSILGNRIHKNMQISLYQIDAFTNKRFHGNPAAVCPLESWLEDYSLQAIASENNLSETAFFVEKKEGHYELRWFTPQIEVDLCGHATLATAFVIFNFINPSLNTLDFSTRSGLLCVEKNETLLTMDFPVRPALPCSPPEDLLQGLGKIPIEIFLARDYLAVYDSEDTIRSLQPDMNLLSRLDSLGIIVTAPGKETDFVSRFFAPKVGIPEDPVTGSAHCTLVPYWAKRLCKNDLHAFQLSHRGGEIFCKLQGNRVKISGEAVLYMKGLIDI